MPAAPEKSLFNPSRTELARWIGQLISGKKRVIAPVQEGKVRIFRTISSAEQAILAPGNAQWSPKEFVFSRTEPLFSYRLKGEEVTLSDPPLEETEQVIVGLHPCDAAGLVRLDKVLMADPYYARRRSLTTVVALGCSRSEPACFCAAVGGSPLGEEGVDILLAEQEDGYLLRIATERGASLVQAACTRWKPSTPDQWSRAADQGRKVAESVKRGSIAPGAAATLERRFEHSAWAEPAQRCIGCGICTFVCPSCSCFDVADEGNSWRGTRCRTWDSCSFALFTLHGSGHNPRPTRASRLRQRILHKFAYFPLRHEGSPMCVGCGRCIQLCPVGIDIHREVNAILRGPEEANHVKG